MTETTKVKQVSVMPKEGNSVESFISQAISANLPVEALERLFALRERVKAEEAKTQFVTALSVFQSECPVITKTKKVNNKDGTLRYMFAPIDTIVELIKKPLAKASLSYRWEVKQDGAKVTAICIVTHAFGHSEKSEFTVEKDESGFMTSPQKFASALTFAKRYSLCNVLGISTGDEDTDATDVSKETTAKSDKAKIVFLLKQLGKKVDTREEIITAVKQLTKVDVEGKNYGEVVGRLEMLVIEKQEHESPDIQ